MIKKFIKTILIVVIIILLSGCKSDKEYNYPSLDELTGYWQYYSSTDYYLITEDNWALYDKDLTILGNGVVEYNRETGYIILYSESKKFDALTILNEDTLIDGKSKKLYKYEYTSN